ncbi:SdiA-regulated domain-containing protein [Pseudomonas sp.]|uniref:SdiA-regulated domain-containing protein n=1 Tax=Pseudomonas sp. TaxID=306 RepID=UPI0028B1268D|nr:SdiA-regulated domain-containing protein [Pseudomonas sp.]
MQNALSSKTMATALACLLVAAAITAGAQQRLFEQVWFRLEQRFSSKEAQGQALWLPDYHVTIDAKPLGNDENMSALTFDASRQTLFTVTNKDSHLIELSLSGDVLRRIPLRGFGDPEAIEYVRPGVLLITEERNHHLIEVHVNDQTQVIDIADPANAKQFSLSAADNNNKGFEGLAYDPKEQRLFVAKEKDPVRIFEINGFLTASPDQPIDIDVHVNAQRDRDLFVTDLSSLHYDTSTGHLLALSDESKMIVEMDANGKPVSSFSLRGGNQGLAKDVPQAEGMTMDDQGNLYVISEPNLFYAFKKKS